MVTNRSAPRRGPFAVPALRAAHGHADRACSHSFAGRAPSILTKGSGLRLDKAFGPASARRYRQSGKSPETTAFGLAPVGSIGAATGPARATINPSPRS